MSCISGLFLFQEPGNRIKIKFEMPDAVRAEIPFDPVVNPIVGDSGNGGRVKIYPLCLQEEVLPYMSHADAGACACACDLQTQKLSISSTDVGRGVRVGNATSNNAMTKSLVI